MFFSSIQADADGKIEYLNICKHCFSNFLKKVMNVFSAIKKICDIYDWDGKGELDMFYLGDVVYALGFNITKKICVGLGQT